MAFFSPVQPDAENLHLPAFSSYAAQSALSLPLFPLPLQALCLIYFIKDIELCTDSCIARRHERSAAGELSGCSRQFGETFQSEQLEC